jgi:hypothetical protein
MWENRFEVRDRPPGLEKRSTLLRIYETSPAYFFPNRYPVAPQRHSLEIRPKLYRPWVMNAARPAVHDCWP